MTAAVVLAAGAGTRMGGNKALLRVAGITFVERIVDTARRAGVARIVVVIGHQADEVQRATPRGADLSFVENPRPERGQLSSLKLALATLAGAGAALAWPVDHPLVAAATVARILGAAADHPAKAVIPCYEERGGHPTLFPESAFADLLALPDDRGARELFASRPHLRLRLPVEDPGVRAGIDTPEDYQRHAAPLTDRPRSI